ncbi:MAG: DNA topoisomerase VI subunit B [archaeon]
MAGEITAEALFKEFQSVQLSEFFRKNRQFLGYVGKIKSLTTVIHELVTNSLDACEEAGILPDLRVIVEELGVEHYKITCQDNGPGIPETHLEKVFGQLLTGTKFHRNIQLRGQQGLGVSGAVLFSQITTGQPSRIKSGTGKGTVVDAMIEMDIKTNSPKIISKNVEHDSWRGTRVESEFKGVQYSKGSKGPFEYVRWTAASNPHAKIYFKDPAGSEIVFERVIDKIPQTPKEIKPHPEGLEAHDLLDLAHKSTARQVSTFLTTELARVSSQKVTEMEDIINKDMIRDYLVAAGISKESAETQAASITPKEWTEKHADKPLFDTRRSPKRIEWKDAEHLVNAFKKTKFMAPPSSGLIPIGQKTVEKALTNLLAPDFVEAITRNPTVYKGGIPFMVEAAIAYGGNSGREGAEGGRKVELMRFANRAPLLFDAGGCALNKSMESIDWKRYHIMDMDHAPVTVFINLVSTHVPYTSAGKQAIAEEDEVVAEVRFALMQIARTLQKFLSGKRRASERNAKKKLFEKYIPETAKAISKLSGAKEEDLRKNLEKIVLDRFGKEFAGGEPEEEETAAYEEIPEEIEEEAEE